MVINSSTLAYYTQLTKREQDVLELLSYGYSSDELAKKLFISTHTIVSHRINMMEKLHARNTAELIRRGFEIGILQIGSIREVA